MSELSLAELQAENVEMLPERETLSTVVIGDNTSATAFGAFNGAIASNHSHVIVIGSGNGNTTVGSFDHNHIF